ncbi:MAG: hypothetical protein II864_12320 [Prevotella sp.]|nr:hypothetical protein [Prevotella sp.]
MKKKIFSLLALVMTAMTASAVDAPAYTLTEGTNEHGTMAFKVGGAEVTSAQEGAEVTVVITADEGYVPATPDGVWYAAIAASRRIVAGPGAEIDLQDSVITFKPVSGKTNEWTFTMARANALVSAVYKKEIKDAWVQDIADQTYNGTGLTPAVTVKDGTTTLTAGTDYTVTYSNNTNAGTATATITGTGNYGGTVTKSFTINKSAEGVHFDPWFFNMTYGDPNFTILPENRSGATLTYKSDNTDVATVNATTGEVTINNAGEVIIYAMNTATANYDAGSDWYKVVVTPKALRTTTVGEIADQAYTGTALTPAVSVKDGETALVADKDYTVSYKNNTGTGTATVTITGTGNYGGTVTKTFNIVMATLALDEETANGETLGGADGKLYDVTLTRSLQAGMWNTFAVPFDVDAATLSAMGITAKELTGSSFDGQTLTLHFADASGLKAGKPYLVKPAKAVTNPVFSKVKVSKTAVPAETAAADFVPTLGKTEVKADDAKSVLFLTSGNKLQYPASLPADFKGFRAYFQLKGAAATARSFELDIDGETTAISAVSGSPADNGAVYTLDGRKVTNPAKKGVYIVNGKKVIIK